MIIDYVPTEDELAHIRFLRTELAWADRKLEEARRALRKYEEEIRKEKELGK